MAVVAIDSLRLASPYVETNPTIAASKVAGPAVSAGGTAYTITARKTSASATDLRLWLTPTVVVMETVNRLAARVRRRSTTQNKRPGLVRSGSLSVETNAEPMSSEPRAEMTVRKVVPLRLLCVIIIF